MAKPKKDNRIISIIKIILEASGLDLIPYALGWSKFESKPPYETTKLKEKLSGLDAEKIDDALIYSKGLLDEESERGKTIENKAYNLIGVTSISAAFITGISKLLPETTQSLISFFFAFLYLSIVIALTLTVLLASITVLVGRNTTSSIEDIFNMKNQSLIEAKKERLYSYLYAYAKNAQAHNIKASSLMGSQLWFRNALILFLTFALVLAATLFGSTNTNVSVSPTPAPISSSTIQPIATKTIPPLATPTSTVVVNPSSTPIPSFPSSTPTLGNLLTLTATATK